MQSHFFRCRVEELVAGQIEAAQRVHAARAARRKQIQKPPDAHGTRLNHLVPAADGLMEAHVLSIKPGEDEVVDPRAAELYWR